MPRPSVADKRRTFRKLHESGCFVIPNPWDVGSARYLQGLGFKALASTIVGLRMVGRRMPTMPSASTCAGASERDLSPRPTCR